MLFKLSNKLKSLLKLPILILCFLIPIAAWLAFGERGFIRLNKLEEERETYVKKIHELSEKNHALLEEINRLRTDLEYVASIAKRDLGLIKENEIIYRFSKKRENMATHKKRNPKPVRISVEKRTEGGVDNE